MRLRTLLFAPGDAPRKIEKALASKADGIILDLEDAVAPARKAEARAALAALLRGRSREEVAVRINPPDTAWYLDDLAAIVPTRPAAVVLPKCGAPRMLEALDHHLEALEAASGQERGAIKVIALVAETAAGAAALPAYAQTHPGVPERVIAFCFGAEDLGGDLGAAPRRAGGYIAPVDAARAGLLLAAAACGVAALDTPYPDPRDLDALAAEARAAASDGFAGKLLIHPAQIAPVREAFTPDQERIAWARAVLAAFEAEPGLGVATLHGKMIEIPHLRLARRILDAAG